MLIFKFGFIINVCIYFSQVRAAEWKNHTIETVD